MNTIWRAKVPPPWGGSALARIIEIRNGWVSYQYTDGKTLYEMPERDFSQFFKRSWVHTLLLDLWCKE